MKKLSAVLLSILMVLTSLVPMASAYDNASVVGGDYSALTDDDVLGIVLDWLDGRIAAVAPDFDEFEQYAGIIEAAGYTIPEITGVDSLVEYKDALAELGGDFANLGSTDLIVKRADAGNTGFVNGLVEFMAANADTFGKVFRWDDQVFDYGKVGEYIEGLEDGNPIKTFYYDYLIGNNIQEKFVGEIAREMGYTIPDGEIFDDTLNNGIKQALAPLLKEILISEESKAAYDAFNLKTTDVYTLVKAYVGLLQNDYKGQFDDLLSGFLTALQGLVNVVESGVNVTPPTATIRDYGTFVAGPYTPDSVDPNKYMPTIYTSGEYKAMIEEAIAGLEIEPIEVNGTEYVPVITVTDDPVPEGLKNGDPTALVDGFKMNVAQGDDTIFDLAIDFSDIEDAVNAEIANQIPTIQTTVNGVVDAAVAAANNMPFIGGSVTGSATVNSITVSLAYAGYSTEDTFTMEVTVTPNIDITYGGNVWTYASMVGMTQEKIEADYIQPAIAEYVKNPVATISVSNLNGEIAELEQIATLLSYIDTDAEYNDALLDVSANYDAYNGVVGQANHILYGLVDMIASDAGMADLDLTDGGNEYLYENLQKICDKVSGLFLTMKQYIDRDTFVSLAEAADISAVFASAHGFNAGMVYDMDFSSVENALDCGIRIACDLLAADDEDSIFYEFHMRVEDLDTLDAIIATTADMILGKLLAEIEIDGWDYTYTAIDAAVVDAGTITAQDAVMDKIVDILYEAATFAVPKINAAINEVIADLNADFDLQLGDVNFRLGVEKGADWEATLGALADRFLGLTDGLIIYPDAPAAADSALLKVSKIADAVLPMTSMFSNYTGLVDMNDALFVKAADGDLSDFLAYFEVKDDAIAGDVPVTKALINASDYIVDAFFPDTVETELYPASETVQQTFTGAESDQGIAARNMVSINNRKADLIPVACRLLKESDILKTLACTHANVTTTTAVAGTCKTPAKSEGKVCEDCGLVIEAAVEGDLNPANHEGGTEVRNAVDATCAHGGYTGDTYCLGCGEPIEMGTATPKSTTHTGGTEVRGAVTANCHAQGYTGDTYCLGCGDKIATGEATPINANNHTGGTEVRGAKDATTEEEGYSGDTYCKGCGNLIEAGHTTPKKSQNFFQKLISAIRGFFQKIASFFKNIF
ncbi:MAG: hypothetical protein IKN72_04860 [Clostridia bacterium]|nr:hypothetical protein [Clostridia bacterium]